MNIERSIFSTWINPSADSVISLPEFCINLVIALVISTLVGQLYIRYGRSLSNRRRFAKSFVLLCVVTTLIISVVSSSLALSLGLVGALSIVRFRAAIKEPEELVYLFLIIAFGVGLGGNRPVLTLVGFLVAAFVIRMQAFSEKSSEATHKVLSICSPKLPASDLKQIPKLLRPHCTGVSLKRFDENEDGIEAVFLIGVESYDALINCKEALESAFTEIRVSFFDSAFLTED